MGIIDRTCKMERAIKEMTGHRVERRIKEDRILKDRNGMSEPKLTKKPEN